MTDLGGPEAIIAGLRTGTIRESDLNSIQVDAVRRHIGQAQARENMGWEQIRKLGRDKYGESEFDADLRHVAERLGNEKSAVARSVLMNSDRPVEIVKHWAQNERALEEAVGVAHSGARLATHVARQEAQFAAHGHLSTSERPGWMQEAERKRPSVADWRSGRAWESASDAEVDAHMAERARAKRSRGW